MLVAHFPTSSRNSWSSRRSSESSIRSSVITVSDAVPSDGSRTNPSPYFRNCAGFEIRIVRRLRMACSGRPHLTSVAAGSRTAGARASTRQRRRHFLRRPTLCSPSSVAFPKPAARSKWRTRTPLTSVRVDPAPIHATESHSRRSARESCSEIRSAPATAPEPAFCARHRQVRNCHAVHPGRAAVPAHQRPGFLQHLFEPPPVDQGVEASVRATANPNGQDAFRRRRGQALSCPVNRWRRLPLPPLPAADCRPRASRSRPLGTPCARARS